MSAIPPQSGLLVDPENPWLGLRSFTEEAREFFFGRSTELNDLYERIVDKPLAILFGQSGLGKSSLLQAALVPRLRKTGMLPIPIRFDHNTGAPPLEIQLLERLGASLKAAGFDKQAAAITARLAEAKPQFDHAAFLWMLFHDPAHGLIPRPGESDAFPHPVFVIDQFEEIFTLGDRPPRRAFSSSFRDTLASLVENRAPASLRAVLENDDDLAERLDYKAQRIRVLLSLREDFLHLLERWRRVIPSLMENRVELRMLNGLEAFEAVVRPGQLRPNLPAIMPDQVGQAVVRFVAGVSADAPLDEIDAVPPLLSLVCAELNAQRKLSGAQQISQAQFEGHSSDILSNFYVRSFDAETYGATLGAVPGANKALGAARVLIEDRLLSADGFRESISFDTITRDLSPAGGPDAARAALDVLVERRLLTLEERGGVRRIELAHDVLVPIVRTSRDERHEADAITRAKAEQARAEAETARIREQRNRLRRLVIAACCLSVVAVVGAIVGWMGYSGSRAANASLVAEKNHALEMQKQAETARKDAQAGFDSAWTSLTSLYDSYAKGTLENTPGINAKKADFLKSQLRTHLLAQLLDLNKERPDHRGTIQYITVLKMDEGDDAEENLNYTQALASLNDALQWCQKQPMDNATVAETYAEILLDMAVARYGLDGDKSGDGFAADAISKIKPLIIKWPKAWKLPYATICLEGDLAWDEVGNGPKMLKLSDELNPIIDISVGNFEPIRSYFTIREVAFRSKSNFDRTAKAYELEKQLIIWFRQKEVEGDSLNLAQLERQVARFNHLVWDVQTQFSGQNDPSTANERRAILNELETTVRALEVRLPKSTIVYTVKGDLLNLQQSSIAAGINTRSPDDIHTAIERHRLEASAIGVGSAVGDLLGSSFKSYTAQDATPQAKASALAAAENSIGDFMSLDLNGVSSVMRNIDIINPITTLAKNDPNDKLVALHHEMMEQYIRLFAGASQDWKTADIDNFAQTLDAPVQDLLDAGNNQAVTKIWDTCYRGVSIASNIGDEKEYVVSQMKNCALALMRSGRRDDAEKVVDDTLALCDKVLADRSWDWYFNNSDAGFCFAIADELHKQGSDDTARIQLLLRRGWAIDLKEYGKEELLTRYNELPLEGIVPQGATPDDAEFFSRFGPNGNPQTKYGMKRFTIPVDFGGTKFPFYIFVVENSTNSYAELLDQFRWLKEMRGGIVPPEILDSFAKLNKIAVDNKVDFGELCVYALGTPATQPTTSSPATQP